ncbi:MAG: hypothetical protein MUO40_09565 [Anaerolineaceae bacterium]|nr:hypothetical protein [Anaerolineaceae bacterium]
MGNVQLPSRLVSWNLLYFLRARRPETDRRGDRSAMCIRPAAVHPVSIRTLIGLLT